MEIEAPGGCVARAGGSGCTLRHGIRKLRRRLSALQRREFSGELAASAGTHRRVDEEEFVIVMISSVAPCVLCVEDFDFAEFSHIFPRRPRCPQRKPQDQPANQGPAARTCPATACPRTLKACSHGPGRSSV